MKKDRNVPGISVVCLLETNHSSTEANIDEQVLAQYISPNENRYQHILGVVERMKELLERIQIDGTLKPLLLQTAYLHDIGYSDRLNHYNFHPLDGAVYAKTCGFPKPVIAAVLFHSGAYESVKQTRTDLVPIYVENEQWLDETDRLFIDLITYCDLHTSPVGKKISVKERIDDIVERYGEDHEVSQFMLGNLVNFKHTIERVERLQEK